MVPWLGRPCWKRPRSRCHSHVRDCTRKKNDVGLGSMAAGAGRGVDNHEKTEAQVDALVPFTSPNAGDYRALFAETMARERDAYRYELSEADLLSRTRSGPHAYSATDLSTVRGHLGQLGRFGLVHQRPNDQISWLADLRGRQGFWSLTKVGAEAVRAVDAVLSAHERSGSLQRTALRAVRDALSALTAAHAQAATGGTVDPDEVFDVGTADDQQQVFADEAQDYISSLHDADRRSADDDAEDSVLADEARFLLRKRAVRGYLESFLGPGPAHPADRVGDLGVVGRAGPVGGRSTYCSRWARGRRHPAAPRAGRRSGRAVGGRPPRRSGPRWPLGTCRRRCRRPRRCGRCTTRPASTCWGSRGRCTG